MKRLERQWIGNAKPMAAVSALAAAISACYMPQAFAQETGARQIEEIVVTVRRRVEMEQDVPIAMKVMSEDFLRSQNITQIEDVGTKVPSLRISGAGGSRNEPIISLRGQRPAESVFSQDPAVPLYFNEIVISPSQGGNLGLYDLESVQVLKGPQGTLFGRNSTGGAVLMTPKRPGNELGGYAEFKVGDYDLYGFEGAVDLPINDSWQMRLSGRKLDREGYQENIADNALHGRKYDDEHSEGVRLSINFDGERLSNLLVLAQDENRIAAAVPYGIGRNTSAGLGWASGIPAASGGATGWGAAWAAGVQRNIDRDDPFKVESDLDSEEYVKNVFASNTTEFEFTDDFSIKNIFGYRKVGFETATDIDGTAVPGWGAWTNGAPGVTWDARPTVLDSEFFSDEFQLLGSAFDQRLDWITGLYWSKQDATQDYLTQQSPPSLATGAGAGIDSGITNSVNTSYGVYAEGTYTFTDQWAVTAGLRQSWDEREITLSKWNNVARTGCTVTGPGGAALADCARTEEETFDSPTWRLSVNYTPVAEHLIYASISTGYRGGGFNTRGTSDLTLKPFDPETVTTYELGHKAEWDVPLGALRTSAAIYFQDYEDIHHTRSFQVDGNLITNTENAAKAEIAGLELDVTYLPIDSLELGLSYSYVDAKYKEKVDLINVNLGNIEGLGVGMMDTSDNDFSYIPKQSLTASATWTLPFDASLGDMSLNASVYWQDKMTTHQLINQFPDMPHREIPGVFPAPTPDGLWKPEDVAAANAVSHADSYAVWNARFDWRSVMASNFDAAVYVNNLTDEQYVLGGLNVMDSGGYAGFLYGAPRTVGASVRYTF